MFHGISFQKPDAEVHPEASGKCSLQGKRLGQENFQRFEPSMVGSEGEIKLQVSLACSEKKCHENRRFSQSFAKRHPDLKTISIPGTKIQWACPWNLLAARSENAMSSLSESGNTLALMLKPI
ncbi:hypothetical protein [Deinococcus cellulosilyticus]|uniref:hypothetical protein n=1 Tax=Deinococcus cellulosilyticus TaxID=401558 RepID=UPI001649924E|nr:hypothetical protein [Deinococcus cellulosilyticus]